MLARRRTDRRERIDRARRFTTAIPATGLVAVVVFGSVARGDFNRWSDIDVLVVLAELHGPPHLRRGNPIVTESLEHGIWLVGDPASMP